MDTSRREVLLRSSSNSDLESGCSAGQQGLRFPCTDSAANTCSGDCKTTVIQVLAVNITCSIHMELFCFQ